MSLTSFMTAHSSGWRIQDQNAYIFNYGIYVIFVWLQKAVQRTRNRTLKQKKDSHTQPVRVAMIAHCHFNLQLNSGPRRGDGLSRESSKRALLLAEDTAHRNEPWSIKAECANINRKMEIGSLDVRCASGCCNTPLCKEFDGDISILEGKNGSPTEFHRAFQLYKHQEQ